MEGIKLVNIDLSGVSKKEQGIKADEELREFQEAFMDYVTDKNQNTKEHLIEEWWDRNQAELGVLEKEGITADEVMEGYPKHLEKLKYRPRKKECIKCGYKKNCCLYQSSEWHGDQEAENCETYFDEVR